MPYVDVSAHAIGRARERSTHLNPRATDRDVALYLRRHVLDALADGRVAKKPRSWAKIRESSSLSAKRRQRFAWRDDLSEGYVIAVDGDTVHVITVLGRAADALPDYAGGRPLPPRTHFKRTP